MPEITSSPNLPVFMLYGTAGWSYKDWEGIVYPENKPKNFNHLLYLSQEFDFVEVNTSFYHIPSLKLTSGWVQKTETIPQFKFWIKVFQNFTHQKSLQLNDQEVKTFKMSLEPLIKASKLEGLLAQFPYSFKLNTQNYKFLEHFSHSFQEFPLAIEFRHNTWNHKDILHFFREKSLIWVNIDQPVISYSLPLTSYITHPEIVYFRLHGRNYQSWFSNEGRDARYNYDYKAIELNQISERIKQLKKLAKKIFISGNNHYKGNAIKNLKELKKILSTPLQ